MTVKKPYCWQLHLDLCVSHWVSVCRSNTFSGVSNIFMFESQEEQRHQEAPCSSLPSSPPQPTSQQLPDLPSTFHCPSSPPPFPLLPVISRRQKVELENRLEVVQQQITRWVIMLFTILVMILHILYVRIWVKYNNIRKNSCNYNFQIGFWQDPITELLWHIL